MIVKTINELDRIFDLLNKEFFENKLKKPIILVQRKVHKNTLGTCSNDMVWINKNNEESDKNYEITLSAEYLNRTAEQIVATLIHEMVHLFCSYNNIKDTSNNCVYHNKKFKEEAEKRGLVIEKDKTVGWSITTLNKNTQLLIKKFNINESAFDYYRKDLTFTLPKLKQITNKYICPKCELKLSSYKQLNLICGDCKVPLEIKENV